MQHAFFAGRIADAVPAGTPDQLDRIARAFADGPPRLWSGTGAALVQIPPAITPQDRQEVLPRLFAGGTRVLLLDGRLDNRDDLIAALGLAGGDDLPDGAVVAAALERWDDDAPLHLLGDFALAAWDMGRRRLMLACDQTGGRTVYYSQIAGQLCFATSLRAVGAFPGMRRVVDESVLARMLLDRPAPPGRTVYAGIDQLRSAGRLIWQDGRILRLDRTWEPDWTRRLTVRDDAEVVETARDLLDRAVTAALRSAGPVVCHLSGGLDSSAVAATAARLVAPVPLHTLTVTPIDGVPVPPEPRDGFYDEWPHAAAVAALHGNMVAHRCPAPAEAAADECDPLQLIAAVGRPMRNIGNIAAFSTAQAETRRLGAQVVLGGVSGNYGLTWKGNAHLADLLCRGRWPGFARELFQHAVWSGTGLMPLLRQVGILAAPPVVRRLVRRLEGRPTDPLPPWSPIHRDFAASVDVAAVLADGDLGPPLPGHDLNRRRFLAEQTWALRPVHALLRRHYGYEIRDPLSYVPLLEFCFALPPEQYLRSGVIRSLARRVLADRLPPQVTGERRVGRQNAQWFHRIGLVREQMMVELERLEHSPLAARTLDLGRMRAIAARWPADATAAGAQASDLISVLLRGISVGTFLRWVEEGQGETSAAANPAGPAD